MQPGLVHDSNATVLADAVRELGGEPIPFGIIMDDQSRLLLTLRRALECDAILLSGGTSKGAGDLTFRAVAELGQPGIIAHGVALKPGKPLCLAVIEDGARRVPVAVLPGFPTSAIFTFHEFVAPVLRCFAGRREEHADMVAARLPMRVNSERGRTEYLLVGLVQGTDSSDLVAFPMGKGSGSVTAFSRADGFVIIPRQREYLEAGSPVDVHLIGPAVRPADFVVIGSHCTGLDFLLGELNARGFSSKVLSVGSTGGLDAAKRGECDIAGIHLLDPSTDTYNRPFINDALDLIRGYGRLQGLVFRPDDKRLAGRNTSTFIAAALVDPDCMMVNRNRGSGTRILIDRLLGSARPAGYLTEARSHNAVAAAVVQGRADWGVAIEPVARAAGLAFLPLREEEYDFIVPKSRRSRPAVQAFVDLLSDACIRA